jgi:hypothetical protein
MFFSSTRTESFRTAFRHLKVKSDQTYMTRIAVSRMFASVENLMKSRPRGISLGANHAMIDGVRYPAHNFLEAKVALETGGEINVETLCSGNLDYVEGKSFFYVRGSDKIQGFFRKEVSSPEPSETVTGGGGNSGPVLFVAPPHPGQNFRHSLMTAPSSSSQQVSNNTPHQQIQQNPPTPGWQTFLPRNRLAGQSDSGTNQATGQT